MAFKDGEMIVVESPELVGKSSAKGSLSAQDRVDMAEVGKKQLLNVC
jgi:hypothetical protein